MARIGDWYYDENNRYVQHTAESIEKLGKEVEPPSGANNSLDAVGNILFGCLIVLGVLIAMVYFGIVTYMQTAFPH